MPDVIFVYSEDWLKVYINDKCVYSNHPGDLEPEVLLGYIGIMCQSVGIRENAMRDIDRDMRPFSEVKSIINKNVDWGDPIYPEPSEYDPDRY